MYRATIRLHGVAEPEPSLGTTPPLDGTHMKNRIEQPPAHARRARWVSAPSPRLHVLHDDPAEARPARGRDLKRIAGLVLKLIVLSIGVGITGLWVADGGLNHGHELGTLRTTLGRNTGL